MKMRWLVLIAFISLTFVACQNNSEQGMQTQRSEDQAGVVKADSVEPVPTVCIWEGVPLRAEPRRKGKWLSGISLGETVQWLGDTAIDSTDKNREYLYLRLSDGTEGWASSYGLVKNAQVAAIKEEAYIYNRPDLLTITDEKFQAMDMVAIDDEQDSWLHVIGEKRKKRGWIKAGQVLIDKKDVAVAIWINKYLEEQGGDLSQPQTVSQILAEIPFSDSYFIKVLEEKMAATHIRDRIKDMEASSDSLERQFRDLSQDN